MEERGITTQSAGTKWPIAAWSIAPAVLVLVALFQFFSAHTLHQSPWKGGGFGMFSTADRPSDRAVRIGALVEGEWVPVEVPAAVGRELGQVRSQPTPRRIATLAGKIALLATGDVFVSEQGVADLATAGETRDGRVVTVDSIRVEVWRLDFDATESRADLWLFDSVSRAVVP